MSTSLSATPTSQPRAALRRPSTKLKTYVLDTSVLLADPRALLRFAEHEVVIPVVVIAELEKKRDDAELGHFARAALRLLDELRARHGGLATSIPVNDDGGELRVELNHVAENVLPPSMRGTDNDARVLAVAKNLSLEGKEVSVVSKDVPMRLKAAALGLDAGEYRNELVADSGWTGVERVQISDGVLAQLYATSSAPAGEFAHLPVNTGLVLTAPSGSALARIGADARLHLVKADHDVFGLHGRSAEQRLALDALQDPEIGIVSLGGRAGTGKSALALCAGLDAVLERQLHRKIMVFRPLYAVGGQDLGFLPGEQGEKMNPWAQAVFDTLGAVVSQNVLDEIAARNLLEVLPLTHIRGRSLHDAFIIVDEAQSLEKNVLLTVMSRVGRNSKIVLTHDVAQRDNLRVGRHDGVAAIVETLKGQPLFAHTTLTRSERSPIAALVTELLERAEL